MIGIPMSHYIIHRFWNQLICTVYRGVSDLMLDINIYGCIRIVSILHAFLVTIDMFLLLSKRDVKDNQTWFNILRKLMHCTNCLIFGIYLLTSKYIHYIYLKKSYILHIHFYEWYKIHAHTHVRARVLAHTYAHTYICTTLNIWKKWKKQNNNGLYLYKFVDINKNSKYSPSLIKS